MLSIPAARRAGYKILGSRYVHYCKGVAPVALVTRADFGTGRSAALTLAKAGCKVMLHYSDQANIFNVYDKIKLTGGHPSMFEADLAKEFEVKVVVVETVHSFGSVDILVHSTGGAPGNPCLSFEDMWELNKSTVLTNMVASKFMDSAGKGRIINVCDMMDAHQAHMAVRLLSVSIMNVTKDLPLGENVIAKVVCPTSCGVPEELKNISTVMDMDFDKAVEYLALNPDADSYDDYKIVEIPGVRKLFGGY